MIEKKIVVFGSERFFYSACSPLASICLALVRLRARFREMSMFKAADRVRSKLESFGITLNDFSAADFVACSWNTQDICSSGWWERNYYAY